MGIDLENGRCVHMLIPMAMRMGLPISVRGVVPPFQTAHTTFPVVNNTMDRIFNERDHHQHLRVQED